MATTEEPNAINAAQYAAIKDRFDSYETRVAARMANMLRIEQAMLAQQGQTFQPPALDDTVVLKPHAVWSGYVAEPNSGPKDGFRPCYFLDLDRATTTVDVTISGDVVIPVPGAFSYTAAGVDPTQPMASFLAEVVSKLGTHADVFFAVERLGTCLGIVGQTSYELANVTVTVK